MATFAPVCGGEMYEFLLTAHINKGRHIIGNTVMFMAHDILAKTPLYENLAKAYMEVVPTGTIIVDNSLCEIIDGTSPELDFNDILFAGKVVGSHFLILPDVMGDADASATKTRQAKEMWEAPQTGQFAYVLQGGAVLEHMAMAAGFVIEHKAKMLCVPRVITNTLGSRDATLRAIGADVLNSYKIHLLGCSNNIGDDLRMCSKYQGITSIDSANPVVAGIAGDRNIYRHQKRPDGFFDIKPKDLHESIREVIIDNVEMMQQDVRYVQHSSDK